MGWTRRGLPLFLLLAGLSRSASAAADPIETEGLRLPLMCTIGETCWVANYVDGKEITCDAIRSVAVR